VRADISQGIEIALYVEDTDGTSANFDDFAFSRRKLVNCGNDVF
jgi:hypothetical protein